MRTIVGLALSLAFIAIWSTGNAVGLGRIQDQVHRAWTGQVNAAYQYALHQ